MKITYYGYNTFLIAKSSFHRKIWSMSNDGYFQGIYQWRTQQQAEAYPNSFIFKLMAKRSEQGTLEYEVIPGILLSEYCERVLCSDNHCDHKEKKIGGQIFPITLFANLVFPHKSGLSDYQGMPLYVSQGAGTFGVPMRLGTSNEISLLNLKPEKNSNNDNTPYISVSDSGKFLAGIVCWQILNNPFGTDPANEHLAISLTVLGSFLFLTTILLLACSLYSGKSCWPFGL